ncbi:branched-chain amino acid ABC transporter substrate-binding protein [Emcibacter sp. SYSU 3D8]|uniref:branched-chain amino acid ABC transporter substrate-binding protein n=1 Tax=Emcibacter sp. SYSU 3D8 TaxID=3133969 RepID=UPI0031FEB6E7
MNLFKRAALVVLAAGFLGACAQEDEIVIGVAGPMTGSEASIGEQMRKGAEKAVADINAAGGLLGKNVRLIVGDDVCDPKQAVSVANNFVSQHAVFVAGHYCSGASIPASDVYAESGVIQISPASTNPQFTERGLTNVFRVCGRDDAQGPTAADYILEKFPDAQIAVVDDKSTYGKGLADQFRGAIEAKGVTPVLVESITARETDYSALVTKLRQAGADVVYFGGYKTEAGLIVRQMHGAGVAATLVGGDALVTEEFWAITGEAGAGTLMTFGPDPRLDPQNAALVKSFRDENYEPEAYTLYTYASIQAWAQAAATAGATDGQKVGAALRRDTFETALGTIDFDDKGDNSAPGYVFYVWENGKYLYAE